MKGRIASWLMVGLFIVAVIIAYLDLSAQASSAGQWTSSGPSGGIVTSLAIDPASPTTVYATILNAGVFKSTDGGANWQADNNGLPSPLGGWVPNKRSLKVVVDPMTPTTLYVLAGKDLYKSTDGADSWQKINSATGIDNMAFGFALDPVRSTTLYFWTYYSGGSKSTDGGLTWNPIGRGEMGPQNDVVAFDPMVPTTLYAGSWGYGLRKSTDGAMTWQRADFALTDPDISGIVIDSRTPTTLYAGAYGSGVFKSTNGAGIWAPVNTGLSNLYVIALAIDPKNPAVLYASTSPDGVFKTTDGGGSWQKVIGAGDAFALAIDPATPSTVYMGGRGNGVFKTTDGGESWQAASNGQTGLSVKALAVNPAAPANVLAGAEAGGLFRSPDRGMSWQPAMDGMPYTTIYTLAFDPGMPGTVYAGTNGGIFKSTDGGVSWGSANGAMSADTVRVLALDPTSPNTLYAGKDYGLFKSGDGGASWQQVKAGSFNVLAVNPAVPTTLYGGAGTLLRSQDGGASWLTVTTLPGSVRAVVIDPVTPTTLYAATNGGVYRSTSEGQTWQALNGGLGNLDVRTLTMDPTTPAILYAGTAGGLFKTTNGGASWQVDSPALSAEILAFALDPVTPTNCYAGTTGGVFQIAELGPPPAATPLSPTGTITDTYPTFTWKPTASAEQYYLWVDESSGRRVVSEWVSAADTGCGSGTGTCAHTSTTTLGFPNGEYHWGLRTWNSAGYGPYSDVLTFTVVAPLSPATTPITPTNGATGVSATPTYSWQAVTLAMQYYLSVSQGSTDVVSQWYTAAQAGCGSGTGTCSVTPATALASGTYQWRVRTWNLAGYGPYSATGTFTVSGPSAPPATTLLSPSGTTTTPTPSYSWSAVPTAEQYYLWVQDSTGLKVSQWYTAAQAGCSSGTGTCSVTPSTPLAAGSVSWRVRTWNSVGYGPYSATGTVTELGTPPTISNLQYAPTNLPRGTGMARIDGSINFVDPDVDLVRLRLTTPTGFADVYPTVTTTSGAIFVVVWVTPTFAGTFQFSVQGFDAMGNASNTLTSSFTVTP